MENVNEIIKKIFENKLITSIIVIIVSMLIYNFLKILISRTTKTDKMKNLSKKGKTYIKLTTSIMRYIFFIITVLVLLQINGVDVSSYLAGLGILSVIIGLAVQDALKDIIRGFSILSDTYFNVGDVVKYNGIEGKVLVIGFRTTKIQDLSTSNVISIANRNIEQVEVVSNKVYINVPMPYETPLKKAEDAMNDIVKEVCLNDKIEASRYLGVNKLDDSSILYLLEITCKPDVKLQARRDAQRVILEVLAKHKIEVPYQQIDIHNK